MRSARMARGAYTNTRRRSLRSRSTKSGQRPTTGSLVCQFQGHLFLDIPQNTLGHIFGLAGQGIGQPVAAAGQLFAFTRNVIAAKAAFPDDLVDRLLVIAGNVQRLDSLPPDGPCRTPP